MTRGYGNDKNRERRINEFSQKAYDLARNIDKETTELFE